MPLLETKGAASAQGFGGAGAGASGLVTYIEDVFSTYLYTGNGSTQTITNNIDLSTKGGMVWIKDRVWNYGNPEIFDTVRGVYKLLTSAGSNIEASITNTLTAFNSNGFSLGSDANGYGVNRNGDATVSWTFRKQPKFFDVVTWTGNNADGRFISHSLGSTPGMVIIKNLTSAYDWVVWHRSLANPSKYLVLNSTAATATDIYGPFGSYDGGFTTNASCFTSTGFYVAADARSNLNANNYVAYVFAHDAGGFGLTGTDNVISCGSFTTGTGGKISAPVNLGYEVQWLLVKNTDASENWQIYDVMRGMPVSNGIPVLYPNLPNAEYFGSTSSLAPTATGFNTPTAAGPFANSSTYIYIAIRRGPMKVPTSGTSVFGLSARTGTGANATVTGSAGVSDAVLIKNRGSAVGDLFASRLTGTGYLETSSTAAEVAAGTTILQANPWDVMDGVNVGTTSTITNASANTYINYLFDRAPSFFDVVCYTGTGSATTFNHNLGAVPELMIFKTRTGAARAWGVYSSAFGVNKKLVLNTTAAVADDPYFVNATPTTTVFYPGNANESNEGGNTYVAYLFATCPGVSKVGTYTGTGALQTINCGFTGGARFVLIKRTDSTGDWYVYDSARGISSGNDPYLFLNSTAAEVTGTNYVDTDSTGFKVTAAAPAGLNANGGSFVFLAIA